MGLKPSLRSRLRKAEEMVRGVNKAGGEVTGNLQTQINKVSDRLAEIEALVNRPVRSKAWEWFCGVVRRMQGIV